MASCLSSRRRRPLLPLNADGVRNRTEGAGDGDGIGDGIGDDIGAGDGDDTGAGEVDGNGNSPELLGST